MFISISMYNFIILYNLYIFFIHYFIISHFIFSFVFLILYLIIMALCNRLKQCRYFYMLLDFKMYIFTYYFSLFSIQCFISFLWLPKIVFFFLYLKYVQFNSNELTHYWIKTVHAKTIHPFSLLLSLIWFDYITYGNQLATYLVKHNELKNAPCIFPF